MARETFLSVPVVVWLDTMTEKGKAIAIIAQGCNGSLERSDANEMVYRFTNAIQGLQFQWEVNRLGLVGHAQLYYPYEIVSEHRLQVESVGWG